MLRVFANRFRCALVRILVYQQIIVGGGEPDIACDPDL
jgi:hypothetical protein